MNRLKYQDRVNKLRAFIQASILILIAVFYSANVFATKDVKMKIYSQAYEDNQEMPEKYTCEGENISPPLNWKEVPEVTKSLVLIIEDPDAPDPKAPKMVWDHWIIYNMDPKSDGLPEHVGSQQLPKGTLLGLTSWKNHNYGGPCPPIGRHRYFHKLFALDVVLPNLNSPTKDTLLEAMKGHVIDEAVMIGTYQKKK